MINEIDGTKFIRNIVNYLFNVVNELIFQTYHIIILLLLLYYYIIIILLLYYYYFGERSSPDSIMTNRLKLSEHSKIYRKIVKDNCLYESF